ncbi:hypothetical protein E4U21_000731 [Claviceps maximensis]|nr:hypothetical protein E4U21_000731 [Claviceps maximensis]
MARPLRPGTKNRLWSPDVGIRFSPTTLTSPHPHPHLSPGPLYPRLDIARFFQTASDGTGSVVRPLTEAADAEGVQAEKDGPDMESNELCIKSNELSKFSSSSSSADFASQHVSFFVPSPTITPTPSSPTLEQSLSDLNVNGQASQLTQKPDGVKPPATSLSFKISSDAFYAARSAKAGSSESFWSHTMYERKSAAGTTEKVQVHYCTNNEAMESICKQYFLDHDVLGFDLEWSPFATRAHSARENVSVIQLASPDHIALFHVAIFPSTDALVSPTFRKIMEDATVSKVGVQIRGDCNRLKNYLDVTAKGVFELSHLYKQIKFTKANTPKRINKVSVALATQVEEILMLPLFKGDTVRSSDWTRMLTQQQILYAASDAYAGVQLYYVLEAERKMLKPCPERPHHLELELPIPFLEPQSPHFEPPQTASPITPSPPQLQKQQTPRSQVSQPHGRDSRLVAADEQVAQYQASKKSRYTRPSSLRAFFLWHSNHDLSLDDLASLLRDPPLRPNTVLVYILDAIMIEQLPHDKQRLKLELLSVLHEKLKKGRYRSLVKSCEGAVDKC